MTTQLKRSERNFTLAYSGLCVAAIADNAYLAYEYLTQNYSACSPNSLFSCAVVANSGYTSLLGIPFWLMGLVWFALLLILGLLHVSREMLLLVLMVGNMFTIYLWYLELGVIHAICPLCVSLYVFNYALTGLVAWKIFS
jgi:uncharacterized membrane protein